MKKKILQSFIYVIIAILLFAFGGEKLPYLDTTTDNYFTEAITKATLAYATCRIINASVSVVKDSHLQLEPAGVGISLAVGQVLDPIDDMAERLSDVLVTAITSLGVQKLVYEISIKIAFPIVAVLIFILSALLWFQCERISCLYNIVLKLSILLIVFRFCLPFASLANNFLYNQFFVNPIMEAKDELSFTSTNIESVKEFSTPEIDGVLGTIKNGAKFLKTKVQEIKNIFFVMARNMANIIHNLLKLTFLYVGIFLIQVIILPISIFWFMINIVNSLFNSNIPVLLHRVQNNKNI